MFVGASRRERREKDRCFLAERQDRLRTSVKSTSWRSCSLLQAFFPTTTGKNNHQTQITLPLSIETFKMPVKPIQGVSFRRPPYGMGTKPGFWNMMADLMQQMRRRGIVVDISVAFGKPNLTLS